MKKHEVLKHAVYLIILLFIPQISIAIETDFTPIHQILAKNQQILGRGGIDLDVEYNGAEGIKRPAYLTGKEESYFFTLFEYENLINRDKDNLRIGSVSRKTGLFIPDIGNAAIGIVFRQRESEASGENRNDELSFGYKRSYREGVAAIGYKPANFLKLGAGLEQKKGSKDLFGEAVLQPVESVSFGIRQYRKEFLLDSFLSNDDYYAALRFSQSHVIRDLTLKASAFVSSVRLMTEITSQDTANYDVKFDIVINETLIFKYLRTGKTAEFKSDIILNEEFGGNNFLHFEEAGSSFGLEMKNRSGKYFFSYRQADLIVSGSGRIAGNFGFWESLLAGERYFNYGAGGNFYHYHIGMEAAAARRLTVSGGVQYIIVKPDGYINHWTPVPVIRLGRLDERFLPLDYIKLHLGVIGLGLYYKFDGFTVSYTIGQIIPARMEKREKDDTDKGGSVIGSAGDMKNIWEKLRENPGGNLQIIRGDWAF